MDNQRSSEFSQLVEDQYAPLCRFARSLTRNESAALDLTQETFLIWAQRGHQLQDRTKAKSWLFTTLYRKHLRERLVATRFVVMAELPSVAAEPSAESSLDRQQVIHALNRLPVDYRRPLVLFYLQQLSYRQIAAKLSIPIGTVMTNLHRGKQRLRKAVESGIEAS